MSKYYLTKDELAHHGIKGQKWGERNYQNEDGSLTPAGKERYGIGGLLGKAKAALSKPKVTTTTKTVTISRNDQKLSKAIRANSHEEYEKDPDWIRAEIDDFSEKNRVGDTDFYLYTRPDGSKYLVGEDAKWNIPAGMSPEEAAKQATAELNNDWQERLADLVIQGKYGNGAERKKKLEAIGADYAAVQEKVNKKLSAKHSDTSGYFLTKEDYLKHHGILGMKWGLRRFQNEDGTYTEEGKLRRREGDSEKTTKRRESAFKSGKDGKPSRAEKLTRSASEAVSSAQRLRSNVKNRNVESRVKEKTKDISKMSNKELQDVVNRYNLEQQYKNVIRQQETMREGKSKLDSLLEVGGAILGVATSAATIYSMLWQIKNAAQ